MGEFRKISFFWGSLLRLPSDALFVPDVTPLLLGLMRELKNLGMGSLPVFSIFAAQSPGILEANSGAADRLTISYPDIGGADALTYYPELGARILSEAGRSCAGNPSCVQKFLRQNYKFDEYGALPTKFKLKVVKDGVWKDVQ